jgi:hypothetical protein
MFCFENYLGSSSLLVKMTEITEKAQTTAPAARTGCLTLGTPFPNGRQLGTYPPWPNSRLLVHMVSNACSASEVTSLGSRFYVHLPMNRSESVNERIGLKSTVEPRSLIRKGDYSDERREACSNQAFAASLSCISRMTIVKTSTSYFACISPATTAANFIEYLVPVLHLTALFRALQGFIPMKVSFVWPFPISSKRITSCTSSMASCSIPYCAGSTLFPFDGSRM